MRTHIPTPPGRRRRRSARWGSRWRWVVGLAPLVLAMLVGLAGILGHPASAQPTPPARPASAPAPAPVGAGPSPSVGDQPPEIQVSPVVPPVVTPQPPVPAPAPAPWWKDSNPQPAPFDIPGQVHAAFLHLVSDLVYGALSGMLDLITHTLLALPDLMQVPQIHDLITITRWVANTIFVLLVVVGGFVVASYETLQTRTSLREYLPRVIAGFLAVNAAPSLISLGINITNALTTALLGQESVDGVVVSLRQIILGDTQNGALFLLLLLLNVLVLMVMLLLVYFFRLTLTILVAIAAPLALACHALPGAERIAAMWWRALVGLLAAPFLQALVFIVYVKLHFDQAMHMPGFDFLGAGGAVVNALLCMVMLYILVRIPMWVLQTAGLTQGRSMVMALVKFAVLSTMLRGVGAAMGGAGRLLRHTPSAARSTGRWAGRQLRPTPTPAGGDGAGFGGSRDGNDDGGPAAGAGSPVRPTPLPPTLTATGAKPLPREQHKVTLARPQVQRAHQAEKAVLARKHARQHWSPIASTPATARRVSPDRGLAQDPTKLGVEGALAAGQRPARTRPSRPGPSASVPSGRGQDDASRPSIAAAITPPPTQAAGRPSGPTAPMAPAPPPSASRAATRTPPPAAGPGSQAAPPFTPSTSQSPPVPAAAASAQARAAVAGQGPVQQAVVRHRVRRRRRRAGVDSYEVTPVFQTPPQARRVQARDPQAPRPATRPPQPWPPGRPHHRRKTTRTSAHRRTRMQTRQKGSGR